jgi:hypothetical protein
MVEERRSAVTKIGGIGTKTEGIVARIDGTTVKSATMRGTTTGMRRAITDATIVGIANDD